MVRGPAVRAGAAIAVLVLAGCIPEADTGYVEIKTFPSAAVSVFYLDATKLEPLRNGVAVLRQQVGTAKLQTEGGGGQLAHLCNLVVRKNRITSVTVSVLDRPMRCQCRNSEAGAGLRSCIS